MSCWSPPGGGHAPTTLAWKRSASNPAATSRVDDQLRASGVPGGWLYAVGDANGRALFTHQGKYQARLCADHILGRPVEAFADHRAVPRVIFTDPQVAAVGLTERQARDQGVAVTVVSYPTGDVAGSSVAGGNPVGTSQIVVDEDRGVVVGATFTGYVWPTCCTQRRSRSWARCRWNGCGTRCRRSRR